MALSNYLINGSYTVLKISQYDKREQSVNIQVQTWTSSNKDELITEYELIVKKYTELQLTTLNHSVQLDGTKLTPDHIYMSLVPGQASPFDTIYRKPAQWVSEASIFGWTDEILIGDRRNIAYQDTQTLGWYISAGDDYVTLDKNYVPNAWDEIFSLSSETPEGQNLIYQAYQYVKLLPGFQDCEDV